MMIDTAPLSPLGTTYNLLLSYDVAADAWRVEQSDDWGYRIGLYLPHSQRDAMLEMSDYHIERASPRTGSAEEATVRCPTCETLQRIGAALCGTLANREYFRCRNCGVEWHR